MALVHADLGVATCSSWEEPQSLGHAQFMTLSLGQESGHQQALRRHIIRSGNSEAMVVHQGFDSIKSLHRYIHSSVLLSEHMCLSNKNTEFIGKNDFPEHF